MSQASTSPQTLLSLRGLAKNYGPLRAVAGLSLDVRRGEIFGILGPSGGGKTTTLRLIAGLERPDAGSVLLSGREITHLPVARRGFGMVFQHYALFPHLNVFENVAFGLRARRRPAPEIAARVADSLALVRLPGYEKRRVTALSGGEQQRVAIARAIAIEPPLLLFDEPLSNLDVSLRAETRAELRELITRLALTAIFVTHDQEEAFALCDRIAIMHEGKLAQTGTAAELYRRPASLFVARFLGRNNLIDAENLPAERARFRTLRGEHLLTANGAGPEPGGRCVLAVRPEHLEISKELCAGENVLPAVIRDIRYSGATTLLSLDARGLELTALTLRPPETLRAGDSCYVTIATDHVCVLSGED